MRKSDFNIIVISFYLEITLRYIADEKIRKKKKKKIVDGVYNSQFVRKMKLIYYFLKSVG